MCRVLFLIWKKNYKYEFNFCLRLPLEGGGHWHIGSMCWAGGQQDHVYHVVLLLDSCETPGKTHAFSDPQVLVSRAEAG